MTLQWRTSAEFNPGKAIPLLDLIRSPRTGFTVVNEAARTFREDALGWVEAGLSFHAVKPVARYLKWRFDGPGAMVRTGARHMVWAETGTPQHFIGPRPGYRAVAFPVPGLGLIVRRRVHHPGTQPTPFFFADLAARESKMAARAAALLARRLESAA